MSSSHFPLNYSLGQKFKHAREYREMTQTDAAQKSGIKQSLISKLELYGASNWTNLKLIQLACAYFMSYWEAAYNNTMTTDTHYYIPCGGKIAIVDDIEVRLMILSARLKKHLEQYDIEIVQFHHPLGAADWLAHNEARLLITDYYMPDLTGGELINRMRSTKNNWYKPAVLVTASNEIEAIAKVAKDERAVFYDRAYEDRSDSAASFMATVKDLLMLG